MSPACSATKPSGNLPALTGIRIIAAFWVLVFHFSQIDVDRGLNYSFGVLDPLIRRGYLGVDVFFVLSGFILTHVYRKHFQERLTSASWREFLQFRVARLYPVHLVSMVLMGVMFLVGAHAGFQPHKSQAFTFPSLLANLTMTHAWFPGVAAMNTPAWSISCEWFAYLWFPAVYFVLWRGRPLLIPFAAAIAITIPFVISEWSPLVQISVEFVLGMAAYELLLRYAPAIRVPWGSLILTIAAITVIYAAPNFAVPAVMLASALAFPCLISSSDWGARILSHRLLVYGGEISYSLYMFHWVVWSFLRRGLGVFFPHIAIPHLALMTVATVASFAAAIIAYHFIELPGRNFLRSPQRPAVQQTLPQSPPQTQPATDPLTSPSAPFVSQ